LLKVVLKAINQTKSNLIFNIHTHFSTCRIDSEGQPLNLSRPVTMATSTNAPPITLEQILNQKIKEEISS